MPGRAPLLLLLLLIITAVEPHGGAGIHPSDLRVLHDLRKWVTNSQILSWPNATDPCEPPGWQGISCDPSGRVTTIKLADAGLEGGLPPTFSSLSSIEFVDLQNNSLSGPLPSFRGMSNLRHANLHNNLFDSIPPDFFSDLSNLEQFSLGSYSLINAASGGWTLPAHFASSVPKLQLLNLAESYLVGEMPEFFGSMNSLQVLILSSNYLSGPLPATFNSSTIQKFWIDQNKFSGTIDFLTKMPALVDVSLYSNQFSGPIPDGIDACKHLRYLNLGSNMLVGMLPLSLRNLHQLTYLRVVGNSLLGPLLLLNATISISLERFCLNCSSDVMALIYFLSGVSYPLRLANSWIGSEPCNSWFGITCLRGKVTKLSLPNYGLNGTISESLGNLSTLVEIRLEENQLTGHVPESLKKLNMLQTLDLSMNKFIGPLPKFRPGVMVNMTGNTDFTKKAPGLKKSNLIKIIVPLVAGLVILICIGIFIYRAVQQRKKEIQKRQPSSKNLDLPFVRFETIQAATANFSDSNVLGEGGFGKVYKGILEHGDEIAVKRLGATSTQGERELENEVNLIAKLQHRNLVRVIGYCIHEQEKLLLYEYLPNKSLDFFIFDATRKESLDWPTRFKIIKGIAKGLLYLHQDSNIKIIHRDIKASNILLDADMIPKISDFGLAKIFGREQQQAKTRTIVGTMGYISPEYLHGGEYSEKSDIYSFGVILLEIISGWRIMSSQFIDSDFIDYAWELWRDGKTSEFMDSFLVQSCTLDEAVRCIQIGLLCCQVKKDDRPLMTSVLLMLEDTSVFIPAPNRTEDPQVNREEQTRQSNTYSINEMSITVLDGR